MTDPKLAEVGRVIRKNRIWDAMAGHYALL